MKPREIIVDRPRDRISCHVDGDDWRHYEFSRRSGLPRGYFDKGVNADAIVVCVCVVCLIVGLAVSL